MNPKAQLDIAHWLYHQAMESSGCSHEDVVIKMSSDTQGAPPSYSALHPTARIQSIELRSPFEALAKLKKYLIEIIAYTVGAPFDSVSRAYIQGNSVLWPGNPAVNSVLDEDEKEELHYLAFTIKDLFDKYHCNQWNLTLDHHRLAIIYAVIDPARLMRVNASYILDMIHTYADFTEELVANLPLQLSFRDCSLTQQPFFLGHQCGSLPIQHSSTVISRYAPSNPVQVFLLKRGIGRCFYGRLEKSLQAQARLIGKVSRDESVRLVLGQALGELQEKLGMGDVKAMLDTFDYHGCVRDGFHGLWKALDDRRCC